MEPPRRWEENKTLRILREADKGGYRVVAVVGYNLDQVMGFVRAAERKRSPLIIQLPPWAMFLAHQASVPIAVHMYYCLHDGMVRQACRLPVDSIMVSMSHTLKEEEIANVKALVTYCHAHGKAATAEPGWIEGEVDGISDTLYLAGLETTAEGFQQHIDAGVDVLAPSFSNLAEASQPFDFHKYGPNDPGFTQSNNQFMAKYGMPLSNKVLQPPTKLGVLKVNVYQDKFKDYYTLVEQNINTTSYTDTANQAIEQVAENLGREIDAAGSSGKV